LDQSKSAMRVDRFFHMAAAEARESAMEIKHGAILVSGGKVIAAGHNSSRASVTRKFAAGTGRGLGGNAPASSLGGTLGLSCSTHSEVAALHNASCVLRGSPEAQRAQAQGLRLVRRARPHGEQRRREAENPGGHTVRGDVQGRDGRRGGRWLRVRQLTAMPALRPRAARVRRATRLLHDRQLCRPARNGRARVVRRMCPLRSF